VDGHAGDTVVSGDQVERERVLDHVDLRCLVDGGGKRALDLGAGRVTSGVHDPVAMMPALASELELAQRCRVERCSEGDQLAQGSGTLGDERADSILVAQPGAGSQRVVEVVLRAVSRTDRGGHAAHRPARRAGRERVLRHDQHPAELAGPQRCREAGDARPDDDDVDPFLPAGLARGELLRKGQLGRKVGRRLGTSRAVRVSHPAIVAGRAAISAPGRP
jgi:hypothetical protein